MAPTSAQTAQAIINNAEARIAVHKKSDALQELHEVFKRGNMGEWTPTHDKLFEMHAALSVELRSDKAVYDALQKTRTRLQQQHMLEKLPSVAGLYLAKATEMVNACRTRDYAVHESAANAAAGLRDLTGADLSTLLKQRAVESAFSHYQSVVTKCLRILGLDGVLEKQFQAAAQSVIEVYRDAGRMREFISLTSNLRKHSDTITSQTDSDQKKVILGDKYAAENFRALCTTKRLQLRAGVELGAWEDVIRCIYEQREILAAFAAGRKSDLSEQLAFQSDLKAVCLKAKQYALCAHVSIAVASLSNRDESKPIKEREILSTQAVLAALCVPENRRRRGASIAHDAALEREVQLAKAFAIPAIPTRENLIADLRAYGVLDAAHPIAQELFKRLSQVGSVSVCQNAAPLINDLLEADPSYVSYMPAIRESALRTMLSVVSECFSQVTIQHFMALTAFYPESEFAAKVEPVIVSVAADPHSKVSVAIDGATCSIRFRSTASLGDRAIGIETEFSQRLSTAMRNCFVVTAAKKPTAVFKSPADMINRIEAERTRIAQRHNLCRLRVEKKEEREQLAKQREQERKQEDLRRRQRNEAARNERRREAELRKVTRQVGLQEAQERRKKLIQQLMTRYKGFSAPLELAKEPQEKFIESITTRLLDFRRTEEMTKESDARHMDYYERACREDEIPKREKHEEDLKEQNRRNFQLRKENRRRQHYEDWQTALETKHRLEKFQSDRRAYEATMQKAVGAAKGKTATKHADQEADIARMMAERNAVAAAEAEPAAAAPKQEEAAPKPAGGGAKWVPKSRK